MVQHVGSACPSIGHALPTSFPAPAGAAGRHGRMAGRPRARRASVLSCDGAAARPRGSPREPGQLRVRVSLRSGGGSGAAGGTRGRTAIDANPLVARGAARGARRSPQADQHSRGTGRRNPCRLAPGTCPVGFSGGPGHRGTHSNAYGDPHGAPAACLAKRCGVVQRTTGLAPMGRVHTTGRRSGGGPCTGQWRRSALVCPANGR